VFGKDGKVEVGVGEDVGVVPVEDRLEAQVLIRTTVVQRDRWNEAASSALLNQSEWIRGLLDAAAERELDCLHPFGSRERYPWQETCRECGLRLRDGDVWLISEHLR
jgi:hypothetical protein